MAAANSASAEGEVSFPGRLIDGNLQGNKEGSGSGESVDLGVRSREVEHVEVAQGTAGDSTQYMEISKRGR